MCYWAIPNLVFSEIVPQNTFGRNMKSYCNFFRQMFGNLLLIFVTALDCDPWCPHSREALIIKIGVKWSYRNFRIVLPPRILDEWHGKQALSRSTMKLWQNPMQFRTVFGATSLRVVSSKCRLDGRQARRERNMIFGDQLRNCNY